MSTLVKLYTANMGSFWCITYTATKLKTNRKGSASFLPTPTEDALFALHAERNSFLARPHSHLGTSPPIASTPPTSGPPSSHPCLLGNPCQIYPRPLLAHPTSASHLLPPTSLAPRPLSTLSCFLLLLPKHHLSTHSESRSTRLTRLTSSPSLLPGELLHILMSAQVSFPQETSPPAQAPLLYTFLEPCSLPSTHIHQSITMTHACLSHRTVSPGRGSHVLFAHLCAQHQTQGGTHRMCSLICCESGEPSKRTLAIARQRHFQVQGQ